MARGYWGPPAMACRCCRSGPKDKFWCEPCDHVCKAPYLDKPLCPTCREPMLRMGPKWRPGRKGKRSIAHSEQAWRQLRTPSPGEVLLAKINGTLEKERAGWTWGLW